MYQVSLKTNIVLYVRLFHKGITFIFLLVISILWYDPGVSIKIEVASGLDRVTDCINKGLLVLFSSGGRGGSKHVLPQKILKFQSPKNAIFSILGTKFEDKRVCFSFNKM